MKVLRENMEVRISCLDGQLTELQTLRHSTTWCNTNQIWDVYWWSAARRKWAGRLRLKGKNVALSGLSSRVVTGAGDWWGCWPDRGTDSSHLILLEREWNASLWGGRLLLYSEIWFVCKSDHYMELTWDYCLVKGYECSLSLSLSLSLPPVSTVLPLKMKWTKKQIDVAGVFKSLQLRDRKWPLYIVKARSFVGKVAEITKSNCKWHYWSPSEAWNNKGFSVLFLYFVLKL